MTEQAEGTSNFSRAKSELQRWVSVVLLVLMLVLGWYMHQVADAANEAKNASHKTSTDLSTAIAQAQATPGQGPAIAVALEQTATIFRIVCAEHPEVEGC